MTRRRLDVLTLLVGLFLVGFAGLSLVHLAGASVWQWSRIAAPVTLVAIGVIGIALSQRGHGRRPGGTRPRHRPGPPSGT